MGLEKIAYHAFNVIHHVWSSLTVPYNAGYGGQWVFNIYVSLYDYLESKLNFSKKFLCIFMLLDLHRFVILLYP